IYDFVQVSWVVAGVFLYSAISLEGVRRRIIDGDARIALLNSILVALDILAITGLVHFTRGVESDLYVLYLLPILLASYSFTRVGITAAAIFVSLCYVGLLLVENVSFLPFLMDQSDQNGLAMAYSQRLWQRILERSVLLVSVAFIWGRFCEHMSSL